MILSLGILLEDFVVAVVGIAVGLLGVALEVFLSSLVIKLIG